MAIEEAIVPWPSVFVRRTYRPADATYAPMGASSIKQQYACPTARWGRIPVEGGTEAVYQRRLSESDDADALRRKLSPRFLPVENPFRTVERFGIQDTIGPPRTRPLLCEWVRHAYRLLPEQLGTTARTMPA